MAMGRYICVRLLHALVILVLVTMLVFVIAQLIPGDAVMAAMASSVDMNDPAVVARVRQQFGLDQSMFVQFGNWLSRYLTGDWGTSIGTGQKVHAMFIQRLPVTLELFLGAAAWSVVIGIPAGIVSALKRNSVIDIAVSTGTMIGVSIPNFWEAIMLIYLLGVLFPILPPSGYVPFAENPLLNLKSMVLPTFVLGTHSAGLLARYVRARQGSLRARGHCAARAQAGDDPGRHRRRPFLGTHARRRVHCRGDLRHSGARPYERRGHLPEGLPRHTGDADRRLGQRSRGQSAGRHCLRLSRPSRAGAPMTDIVAIAPVRPSSTTLVLH